jgi:hypothetical protein
MCTKTRWGAGWLAFCVALLGAGRVSAQNNYAPYATPEVTVPIPTSINLPDGGPFFSGEYVMFQQTNPTRSQAIAFRGFTVTAPNFTFVDAQGVSRSFNIGQFVGSQTEALDANQVSGQQYEPGYKWTIGYRFQDGGTVSFSDMRLFNTTKMAAATFAAAGFNVRQDFADSFLSAPVFNFPPEFSGPDKITDPAGNVVPGAAIGMWNAASIMTLKFQQRTEQWDVTYRAPAYVESEECRMSVSIGGRYFRMWEGFQWLVIDLDATTGDGGAFNTAIYQQLTSNNLWGPWISNTWEQYLGYGFAFQLETGAAALLDIVRERAKYSPGFRFAGPQGKKSESTYTVVPELWANLSLMWYPIEGVQVKLGYDVMGFFNTIGSRNPVDFNFATPSPNFNHIPLRLFDGFEVGIGFIF